VAPYCGGVDFLEKKSLRSNTAAATLSTMEEIRYRGRTVTEADIDCIRTLIAANPSMSRCALSKELCRRWDWRQDNGALRDMVCRGMLLTLHRAGRIELPASRWINRPPIVPRRKPESISIDQTPFEAPLSSIRPLQFRQVRRTPEERLFNSLLEQHHYLGYTQPVGEHLKFMVYAADRPVACVAWSSAARHLGARDRYIGWSSVARRRNIRFIAYNPRYLIMPWVRVPHLASHVLGWMARNLSKEWERVYQHPVYFLETFVDVGLYRGTCYRAANWVSMGITTGRGKNDLTHKANRPVKEVLGLPLVRRFRELLCEAS
jgi:hypothetical protein